MRGLEKFQGLVDFMKEVPHHMRGLEIGYKKSGAKVTVPHHMRGLEILTKIIPAAPPSYPPHAWLRKR